MNVVGSRDGRNGSSGFLPAAEDEQVQAVLSGQRWDDFLNFSQVARSFTQKEIRPLYLQKRLQVANC